MSFWVFFCLFFFVFRTFSFSTSFSLSLSLSLSSRFIFFLFFRPLSSRKALTLVSSYYLVILVKHITIIIISTVIHSKSLKLFPWTQSNKVALTRSQKKVRKTRSSSDSFESPKDCAVVKKYLHPPVQNWRSQIHANAICPFTCLPRTVSTAQRQNPIASYLPLSQLVCFFGSLSWLSTGKQQRWLRARLCCFSVRCEGWLYTDNSLFHVTTSSLMAPRLGRFSDDSLVTWRSAHFRSCETRWHEKWSCLCIEQVLFAPQVLSTALAWKHPMLVHSVLQESQSPPHEQCSIPSWNTGESCWNHEK